MNFKELKEPFSKTIEEDTKKIKLHRGRTAPLSLYNKVEEQANSQMHTIKKGERFTLKKLCGRKFWDSLCINNENYSAGRCFAHMVCKGKFPLIKFVVHTSHVEKYELV